MNKKIIPIVVRLRQNNNEIIQGVEQNDAGVIFDMTITDGLKAFDFSGYSIVTLKIKKPDGTFRYDSSASEYVDIIDSVNGRLKLNIPTSCTVMNGMHFCTIGFGYDETTYFETASFNYFVGENPNAENEDVIGTSEFPVLSNLIAQASGLLSSEQIRMNNEEDRLDAETQRNSVYATLIALVVECIGFLEDKITDMESMLNEFNQAIAQGGSVDISTISALATKSYVSNALTRLDFGDTESPKTKTLVIYHGNDVGDISIEEGELYYDAQYNRLWAGAPQNTKNLVNEPCFIASASAPTDTEKLWIDISGSAPVIKYYDGTAWTSCNTAVFA